MTSVLIKNWNFHDNLNIELFLTAGQSFLKEVLEPLRGGGVHAITVNHALYTNLAKSYQNILKCHIKSIRIKMSHLNTSITPDRTNLLDQINRGDVNLLITLEKEH